MPPPMTTISVIRSSGDGAASGVPILVEPGALLGVANLPEYRFRLSVEALIRGMAEA
jgi:hypothetical protein